MTEKEKEQIKAKQTLLAFLFFCGGLITGGLVERKDTENKLMENYQNSARVVYQEEEYSLPDLYQLKNDGESHICILDSDVYYDVQDKEIVAVKDFEQDFGYEVIDLMSLFPYEEYGTVIDKNAVQEDFGKILIKKR